MTCTKENTCTCGGKIILNPLAGEPDSLLFACGDCTVEYSEMSLCGGNIKKVWDKAGAKVTHCVCESCGMIYSASVLDCEAILLAYTGL